MFGAFPSRIARWRTGRARPSISRKMIPGASVIVCSPERRAIRWMTRYVYVSSSFVPKSTSSTTPTAAATSATPRADQNESIARSPFVIQSAAKSISASSTRISSRPRTSINGRRSAATIGGSSALSTAITATTTRALQKLFTCAPGTIQAATRSAAADRIQARITATGRNRGRAGRQAGSDGAGGWLDVVTRPPMISRRSGGELGRASRRRIARPSRQGSRRQRPAEGVDEDRAGARSLGERPFEHVDAVAQIVVLEPRLVQDDDDVVGRVVAVEEREHRIRRVDREAVDADVPELDEAARAHMADLATRPVGEVDGRLGDAVEHYRVSVAREARRALDEQRVDPFLG